MTARFVLALLLLFAATRFYDAAAAHGYVIRSTKPVELSNVQSDRIDVVAPKIHVRGTLEASRIRLVAEELLNVDPAGAIHAREAQLEGHAVMHVGTIAADSLTIRAHNVFNQGDIEARERLAVQAGDFYAESRRGHVVAGDVTVQAAHLFSSGSQRADVIRWRATDVKLAGAALEADRIYIGADDASPDAPLTARTQTRTLHAGPGSELVASEAIVLASLEQTRFTARARAPRVELSSAGDVGFGGVVDSQQLVIDPRNITIQSDVPLTRLELLDPTPSNGDRFGAQVVILDSGNLLVSDTYDDAVAMNAGAVHMFTPEGVLLATLTGSSENDRVGWITTLANGNYYVFSGLWDDGADVDAGALTWGDGAIGTAGVVSTGNSFIGHGGSTLMPLANGHLVVASPNWDGVGAVTWLDGTMPTLLTLHPANSLVGSTSGDKVGYRVEELPSGDYIVRSPEWSDDRGAVTWCTGTGGCTGVVGSTNSLVGSSADDQVGDEVVVLPHGDYVVASPLWDNGLAANAGAVTWCSATGGCTGTISVSNSLVGTRASDVVGETVTALANGNYVVSSPDWDDGLVTNVGAATWADGHVGLTGTISATNSLIGTTQFDRVGADVVALANGHYVVTSSGWDGAGGNVGAVTWGNGDTGTVGVVSEANSLVGSASNQVGNGGVTALSNGHYVVSSVLWDDATTANDVGAVTWCDGTGPTSAVVSASNSIVGSAVDDRIGNVTPLTNGHYVVSSDRYDGAAFSVGVVRWADGNGGTVGVVSAANSLVGSSDFDAVGEVVPLDNGSYVVLSPDWDGAAINTGAATWCSGTSGCAGAVSAANSLIGDQAYDQVGYYTSITTLASGNYLLRTRDWHGSRGAVTWFDGASPLTGVISSSNSLVGTNPNDTLGQYVASLTNGHYLVSARFWDGAIENLGAVAWGDGLSGTVGELTSANSLIGTSANDFLSVGTLPLSNGDYLVVTRDFDDVGSNEGSVTALAGDGPTAGVIDTANSIIGPTPQPTPPPHISVQEGPEPGSFIASFYEADSGHVYLGWSPSAPTWLPEYASFAGYSAAMSTSTLVDTLAAGTDVVLEANNDITVAESIVVPAGGGNLTLAAGRSVRVDADITLDGELVVIANDVLASGVVDAHRDPGDADIVVADTARIDASSVSFELRDGAGKTHVGAGTLELKHITATSVIATASAGHIEMGDVGAASVLALGEGAWLAIDDIIVASSPGDAITLATDAQLVNAAGADALDTPNGRFLVYAPTPSSVTPNGLTFSFEEYDKLYPQPPEPNHTGSGILYASIAIPTGGPEVTVEQAPDQADPTSDDTIAFDVTFSEAVVGLTADAIDLSMSDEGDALSADLSGGPSTFRLLVSGMMEDGMVIAHIPAGAAASEADGSPNVPSTSEDNVVTWRAAEGEGEGGAGGSDAMPPPDAGGDGGCACSLPTSRRARGTWVLLALGLSFTMGLRRKRRYTNA